jgi:hypothetical protein
MNYNLKDKLEVTEELLNDLITKSWQEAEALQQQAANIDTSTQLGVEVVRLLKNTCTNYYVLIGCLEALAENTEIHSTSVDAEPETVQDTAVQELYDDQEKIEPGPGEVSVPGAENINDFEPFEYFVDFDEPSGEPISDKDLYGN